MSLVRPTTLLAALALMVAPGASAHGGPGAEGYVSTVNAIRPVVPGLSAAILGGDELISVRNWSNRTVVVFDARGRPMFRFAADGVSRRTDGRWRLVKRGTSHTWHDPRIHWGGKQPPAAVRRDASSPHFIRNWRIRATVDGKPVAIEGALGWAPP